MADPRLRALLKQGSCITAPGVYDMISARIADRLGFDALYMTGYGTVASSLGLPDAGLATFTDMLASAARMVATTQTPLIADADTGYGGLLNVRHTVRGYEGAGVSAIQLEDQDFPKKCGHTPGRRVVPLADMVRKVRVAVDARRSENFLVIARTDARTELGLAEAIDRARAYSEAGADIVFVEAPESEAELAEVAAAVDAPLMANMVNGGGRTPLLSAERFRELGYALVIYPALGFLASGAALEAAYGALRRDGDTSSVPVELYPFPAFNRLMGFEAIWEFEGRYAELP